MEEEILIRRIEGIDYLGGFSCSVELIGSRSVVFSRIFGSSESGLSGIPADA